MLSGIHIQTGKRDVFSETTPIDQSKQEKEAVGKYLTGKHFRSKQSFGTSGPLFEIIAIARHDNLKHNSIEI